MSDLVSPKPPLGDMFPIPCITFRDHEHNKLAQCALRELLNGGAVVLRGLPIDVTNTSLVRLALALGRPTKTTIPHSDKRSTQVLESGFVHRVEALPQPLKNSFGAVITSTSSEPFNFHTDEYLLDQPAELVLLHCVIAASKGGATMLARVRDVLNVLQELDPESHELLQAPVFPYPRGFKSAIRGSTADPMISFNPYEIYAQYQFLGRPVPPSIVRAISSIQRTAEGLAIVFSLAPEDCLVIDNRRILHGRERFDAGSKRLLKRVRLWVGR